MSEVIFLLHFHASHILSPRTPILFWNNEIVYFTPAITRAGWTVITKRSAHSVDFVSPREFDAS